MIVFLSFSSFQFCRSLSVTIISSESHFFNICLFRKTCENNSIPSTFDRGQLLSEAVTQIFLMISLYRLYLLLLDVGRRKMSETPPLMLRVGPCCCWPCLPFPNLQMTDANLSWIGILALQLPIAQVKKHLPPPLLHASIIASLMLNNYYNYRAK